MPNLREARANLSKIIDELGTTGPVEITKYGKVVAVLSAPTGPKSQTGSFSVEFKEPTGIHPIPNTAKQQQAARDALLNAMNKKVKG